MSVQWDILHYILHCIAEYRFFILIDTDAQYYKYSSTELVSLYSIIGSTAHQQRILSMYKQRCQPVSAAQDLLEGFVV